MSRFLARSRRERRPLQAAALLLAVLAAAWLAFSPAAGAETSSPQGAERAKVATHAWPEEVVELFARMPILDRGRVKPLNTFATYALLHSNYSRRCKVPAPGQTGADPELTKLGPVEWLLDVLFFPEVARDYDCFMVETDEVLTAIGLSREGLKKKKRDRYSYEFLSNGRIRLRELAREYHRVDPKDRDPVQAGIVELEQNLREFEVLLGCLDWARASPYALPSDEALRAQFGGKAEVRFSELVRAAPRFSGALAAARAERGEAAERELGQAWQGVLARLARGGTPLDPTLLPPTKEQVQVIAELVESRKAEPDAIHAEDWLSPYGTALRAVGFPQVPVADVHLGMLDDLEAMVHARDDMQTFEKRARSFADTGEQLALRLGKGEKLGMEVSLFRWGLLTTPRHFYLLAFFLVAVSWFFARRQAWYDWLVIAPALLIPTFMLVAGITFRSILRERPPMSTLYDTILFITGSLVIVLLIFELINKRRIALSMAPVLGFLGVLMAVGYENLTREDTMPRLVAVLDTNFWLATHVTCIALGYMASLGATAVGNVYVLSKVVGLKKNDPEFYRTLGRMLYGMLAFGLIFATVGTILGGIWANESWGRFWGWDPKENGALMIVLWQLAMVHGRLGGYIKTFGLAMASLILGIIVAFSWWGVNLLGIGLHSYGFTQGVSNTLNIFYFSQILLLVVGSGWWLARRQSAKPARA